MPISAARSTLVSTRVVGELVPLAPLRAAPELPGGIGTRRRRAVPRAAPLRFCAPGSGRRPRARARRAAGTARPCRAACCGAAGLNAFTQVTFPSPASATSPPASCTSNGNISPMGRGVRLARNSPPRVTFGRELLDEGLERRVPQLTRQAQPRDADDGGCKADDSELTKEFQYPPLAPPSITDAVNCWPCGWVRTSLRASARADAGTACACSRWWRRRALPPDARAARQHLQRLDDVGRLVALAPVGDGRQVGGVGLDQDAVERARRPPPRGCSPRS